MSQPLSGLPLQGKISIVTGASRGIGRSIAVRLAAAGSSVVLTARDQALLDAAAAEIRAAGGTAESIALDLRAPGAGRGIVEFAIARFGRIDIVVNNAGATKRGDFLDLTDDDFADGFALKYFGSVRLTRAAWSHLKAAAGSVDPSTRRCSRSPRLWPISDCATACKSTLSIRVPSGLPVIRDA
jgi:NAD(P)-dependent dehydrogenase (short-subunit alcohol dehydrogenase family)